MRLFIAIELADEARTALVRVQAQLRGAALPVQWVAPEAMHLTLQFLGETDAPTLAQINAVLDAALRGQRALTLQLAGLGAFPDARQPSVVWAGVGGARAALEALQQRVAAALAPLALARDEHPFRAHITLGRTRRTASAAQQMRLGLTLNALAPPAPVAWPVERIVLFESVIRSGGPVYHEVRAWHLAGDTVPYSL